MQILVRAISALVSSLIGLVVGALVSNFVAGLVYVALFGSGPVTNSYECARSMAWGWLSLFAGALVGICVGGYCGYRFFEPGNIGESN